MRRPPPDESAAIGSDSFLDVVTNIVGILIILVMVVGMRAKNAPVDASAADASASPIALEIQALSTEARETQQDLRGLHRQAQSIEQTLAIEEAGRHRLGVLVAAAEKDLESRKAKLDSSRARQFEVQAQLASAQTELQNIRRQIELASDARQAPVEVKAFATPISKTVLGKEIHFRLAGGRVAYLPIEELFELAREETRRNMTRVADLADRVMTVGPKMGFEMRYTVDVSIHERQGQMAVRSKEWQVVPVQPSLGERLQEALPSDSNFRRMLSRGSPKETTITLWTYPDSFAEFRALNEELHRLGYVTAGRPLPAGFPIGGSPQGTKSAAQ